MTGKRTTFFRLTRSLRHVLPAIVLMFTLLALQAWDPSPVQALRLKVFDAYQRLIPARPIDKGTLIVDIDDKSLNEVGQWPWDRATIADLIDRVNAGKPQVIGLDIVFPEVDRLSPPRLISRLAKSGIKTVRPDNLDDTDQKLAQILANEPVVSAVAAAPIVGPNPLPWASVASMGGDPRPYLPRFKGAIANLPMLTKAAKGAGNITIEPGLDGVVRQMPLLSLANTRYLPALSVEMQRLALGDRALTVKTETWGVSALMLGDKAIPLDGHGRLWLRYGPHDNGRFISALDVLQSKIDPSVFANRKVIIGSSAFGLWDIRATPLGMSMPGVEIQAQTIDQLSSGDVLKRPIWTFGLELLMTLAACLFHLLLDSHIKARWSVVGHAAIISIVMGVSWVAFSHGGWLIDGTYAAVAATLVYLALIYAGHTRSEHRRESITHAFKKYLSPVLVEKLSDDAAKLKLGGETRETTTLFADLQGFTPLSEKLQHQPERLTKLVNMLLDTMSEAVLAHDGTIDKFMGDNVMAFWNAPLDDPRHAEKACTAAVDMQKNVAALDTKLKSDPDWSDVFDGSVHISTGIGINTGTCVVGNFGSRNRFDYSAIGDSVNLASRLEGAAKRYGIAALVTQSTTDQAGELAFLPLGKIFVRGRGGGVDAYALVGGRERRSEPAFTKLLDTHRAILAAAEASSEKEFDALIEMAIELAPDLTKLYNTLQRERRPAGGASKAA